MKYFKISRRKFLHGMSAALASLGLTSAAKLNHNAVESKEEDLTEQLNSLIEGFSGNVSLHAHNLTTQKVFSVKSDWVKTSAKALSMACKIIAEPEKHNYPASAAQQCKKIMARHFEDNGMPRFLPWSPFAEDVKAMEQFHDYLEEYAGIEYYGKAGAVPGYRGDTALFITKKSTYVIGLKCTNIQDAKPLNAANEGYTFSANIGRLFYKCWG